MENYNVNYTDKNTTPINLIDGTENNTSLDISIFGNTFLEYGQELNENLLHLLEHFACPMVTGGTPWNAVPDTNNASYNKLLSHPTQGQIWYNSTLSRLYYWDATHWRPISKQTDIAANWGIMADGYQLPHPVSFHTGYVFPYTECIWSVSPANFGGTFDYMACSTDTIATVNMKYRYAGATTLTSGIANYLIIGIRGNTNTGVGFGTQPPAITQSPTSTPAAPTQTASHTPAASVSPTPTMTPTPSLSVSESPIPSGTARPTPTATRTPTPTRSRTPTPTPSNTHSAAAPTPTSTASAAAPTQTATHTPAAASPTPTPSHTPAPPTPTASPIHPLSLTYGPSSLSLNGSASYPGQGHTITAKTSAAASITVSGGVPPYTYNWQVTTGSRNISFTGSQSSSTFVQSSNTTPTASGGTCDSCTNGQADCPSPDGENVRCTNINCVVTDSRGNTITSPTYAVTLIFVNSS